jgi:hypothetical protein
MMLDKNDILLLYDNIVPYNTSMSASRTRVVERGASKNRRDRNR